jgi:hypothetical protein
MATGPSPSGIFCRPHRQECENLSPRRSGSTRDIDLHPEPHPEPGRELDCGERAPVGGVMRTSWKTPPTGSETTTNAGELLTVPVAQLG